MEHTEQKLKLVTTKESSNQRTDIWSKQVKKKQNKSRQKKRMTELDIRMVVEEIEAWRNGERGSKLTWAKLERIFPFTRQTMYSKESIREAYNRTRILPKRGKNTCELGHNELSSIYTQNLKNRLLELEFQIEEWQKLWISLKV